MKTNYSFTGILGSIIIIAIALFLVTLALPSKAQCSYTHEEPFIVTKGQKATTDDGFLMAYGFQEESRVHTNFPLNNETKDHVLTVTYKSAKGVFVTVYINEYISYDIYQLEASENWTTVTFTYSIRYQEVVEFFAGWSPHPSWFGIRSVCIDEEQQQQTIICLPVWIQSQGRRVK